MSPTCYDATLAIAPSVSLKCHRRYSEFIAVAWSSESIRRISDLVQLSAGHRGVELRRVSVNLGSVRRQALWHRYRPNCALSHSQAQRQPATDLTTSSG